MRALTADQLRRLPADLRNAILAKTEERRRAERRHEFLHDSSFPQQTAFVLDDSRRKAALCTRRAGKSVGVAKILIAAGLSDSDPTGESLYIAGSKSEARGILGPSMDLLNRDHALGMRCREVDNQLIYVLPNGHRIWLAGCGDSGEAKKFRGRKFKACVVDEAQNYAFLDELVQAVLQPALIDKRGQLILAGTPSPVPAGLFYQVTTGDGGPQWPTHRWSLLDNPYLPGAREELASYRTAYGWDENHPTYRREWLGEWVRDAGALVYPYSYQRNGYFQGDYQPGDARRLELPPGEYTYALAVDIGFVDATAFTIGCIRKGHPEIYVLESWKEEGLIPTAVAAHIENLKFRPEYRGKLHRVVIDEGGAGKGWAEQARQGFGLSCQPAEKQHKRTYQEFVAGDLLSGVIRIHPTNCRALINELSILQWNPEKTAEDERFANHCADSFLYLCRALKPYYRPEKESPKPGTPEWYEAERVRLFKQVQEEQRRKLRGARRWS